MALTVTRARSSAALPGFVAALAVLLAISSSHARAQVQGQTALAYPIYANGLQAGWENYSWGASVDVAATAPGLPDQRVIALTVVQPYGALHLHSDNAVDVMPYAALTFDIEATAPDQVFTAVLYDQNDQQISKPKPLALYGGMPLPGAWKTYIIPLGGNGVNAQGRPIRSVVIQSDSGHTEPTVYFKQIGFVTSAGALPAPSAAPPGGSGAAAGLIGTRRHVDHAASNRMLYLLTLAVICLTVVAALLIVSVTPQPEQQEEPFVPFSSEHYRRPPAFR